MSEIGKAVILDNRDGSKETVSALRVSIHHARRQAFASASAECKHRNAREGWARFVPIKWQPEGIAIRSAMGIAVR